MIFSSPSFLWALGLLAIPIIIHLFQFRRYKQLYFPDISLLQEIKAKSQTKNQLKHLLVLASRLLFLAALILAFAEPFIPSQNAGAEKVNLVSIYVDNSFSMQNQGENGPLLNEARQKAFEIAESYPGETRFQLITNELASHQRRFNDLEAFLAALDQVQLSPHYQGLQRIMDFHVHSKEEQDAGNSILYLLSDFSNTLDSSVSLADSSVMLRAVPLAGLLEENLSVDSVWTETPIIQPGKEQELHLRVSNHGNEPRLDVPLEMRINGAVIAGLNLTLEAGQHLDTAVTFMVNEAGNLKGEIAMEDSPIDFDNVYVFDIEVQPTITVLEVRGNDLDRSTPFSRLFSGEDFEYRQAQEGLIRQDSAAGIDLLVLNRVSNWSSGLFALISDMGAAGKSVLVVLPGEMNEASRAAMAREWSVNPASWDTAALEVNRVLGEDALFSGVFESQPANLNYPFVKGHWKITGETGTETVMQLFDGTPLLLALRNGNGRIFIITTPLDDEHTNFHKHALFVPAVFNMALTSGVGQQMAYTIGIQKIHLPQRLDETARISALSDSLVFIPGISYDGIVLNDRIRVAGYYELLEGETRVETLSFNYDRRESALNAMTPEELEEKLQQVQPGAEIMQWDENTVQKEIHQADLGQSLWPLFIALALLFLVGESALIKLLTK